MKTRDLIHLLLLVILIKVPLLLFCCIYRFVLNRQWLQDPVFSYSRRKDAQEKESLL